MSEKLDLTLTPGLTFGPEEIYHTDSAGDPVPLAGWKAYAEVRVKPGDPLVLNLNPTITNDDDEGRITLAEISSEDTKVIPTGDYQWDLILENNNGKRFGPVAGGRFVARGGITDAAALPQPAG